MRSQLYLLASRLFNQPTAEHLAVLQHLMTQLLQTTSSEVPWRETLIALKPQLKYEENRETEYSRLFILAFPNTTVQPFGSYWLENDQCLMGRSTLEVKKMMAEHGIEIAEDTGFLPDHIVSELEFMALLASQDNEKALQTQQQLLEQHLALWIPRFIAALRAANPASYYQLAADFLEQLIESEIRSIK